MVEIADIGDKDSLRAWLEDQPQEVAVWIASRAAARVLPVWWKPARHKAWASGHDLEVLLVLRSVLISSVAAMVLTEGFRRTAVAILHTLEHKPGTPPYAAAHGVVLATAGIYGPPAYPAAVAVHVAFDDAHSYDRASGRAVWHAVRTDAAGTGNGGIPDAKVLWPEGRGPLAEQWDRVKARVAEAPEARDWQFWTYWYDALLDGRPMLGDAARTRKMLEDIALIAPETWDAGPEVVNPAIREIWELHHLRAEVAALRAEKERLLAGRASPEARSHNQPPELVDSEPQMARQVEIIWGGLDDAQDELERGVPDKRRLQRIAEEMLAALKAVAGYCSKVGDRVVMSTATASGPFLLDQVFNNGRLWQFVRDLLSFSGGG